MSERQEHPVLGLVGARVERVALKPLSPGDSDSVYLLIVFEDGRDLEVWAMNDLDSATLNVRVGRWWLSESDPAMKEQGRA